MLKRALSIWDKKSVHEQDWFCCFLCILKRFAKNDFCISMKITMTAIGKRQRAHFKIYKRQKKAKRSYIKKPGHFSKSKTICITFYIQKTRNFRLRDFSWNFWIWHLYTKIMSLCVTWRFYTQNGRNFEKPRKFALRFNIQKAGHFALHDFFIKFLKLGKGGVFLLA